MLLTLDTGTTNTRVRLLRGRTVLAERSARVGVRDTAITGSTARLREAIRTAILSLLQEAQVGERQVEVILASGMITSDLGLCMLPHLSAPASAATLGKGGCFRYFPDISDIPFFFIPGVRNPSPASLDALDSMDMMRGEETEALGMLTLTERKGPFLAVLPGSHTKLVRINAAGEILGCATTLSGEMISALSQNTILKDSLKVCDDFDPELLYRGYAYSTCYGLNKACFRVRLMDVLLGEDKQRAFSFFAGAVLAGDIQMIRAQREAAETLLVGGSGPLRRMFLSLLERELPGKVFGLAERQAALCPAYGAMAVWHCVRECVLSESGGARK